MSVTLKTCPKCGTSNFTVIGLAGHMKKCKGQHRETKVLEMEVVGEQDAPGTALAIAGDEIGQINALHQRATALASAAKAQAEEAAHLGVLMGVRLGALKERLPHGSWGNLFADSEKRSKGANPTQCRIFDFSCRTAERYMATAKKLIAVRRLTTKKKAELLKIANSGQINEEQRAVLNKLTDGQTLRQLYLDLGIISGPPRAGGDTSAAKKPKKHTKPNPDLERQDAEAALTKIMADLARWFEQGRHQLLHKPQLRKLDELLVGSRETIKPLL